MKYIFGIHRFINEKKKDDDFDDLDFDFDDIDENDPLYQEIAKSIEENEKEFGAYDNLLKSFFKGELSVWDIQNYFAIKLIKDLNFTEFCRTTLLIKSVGRKYYNKRNENVTSYKKNETLINKFFNAKMTIYDLRDFGVKLRDDEELAKQLAFRIEFMNITNTMH